MNTNILLPFKSDENTFYSLTTPTNDSSHMSDGGSSPSTHNNEQDSCSINSKKIRKKRNAYQKIDDDTRLKLLEDVQQNGETLKAAARKYNINYSSAKSILFTYRKEGRILKKSGQERFFSSLPVNNDKRDVTAFGNLFSNNNNMSMAHRFPVYNKPAQYMDSNQINLMSNYRSSTQVPMPHSPTHGLADNFGSMLRLGTNNSQFDDYNRMKPQASNTPNMLNFNHIDQPIPMNMNAKPQIFGMNLSPVNALNLSQAVKQDPIDNVKYFDNFYMNYSNSPLSGGMALRGDNTDSSSGKYAGSFPREFDSFSEMITALQNHPRQAEDVVVPHPVRFNTAQMLQDKIDSKLTEDDVNWNGAIENAAIDTYKSFVDAQFLLNDAVKKASYLNNLVQVQKLKPDASPMNDQY